MHMTVSSIYLYSVIIVIIIIIIISSSSSSSSMIIYPVLVSGLFRFYQLLTLGFFVLGCIYGPQMYESLHMEDPMALTIQLLSGTLVLQASGSFLVMIHLRR